ncbi:hypothetical protein TNCV_1333641 [Trichonephila clavipes]|nr:hypothetical protein TNCV_1333641 [Trichonephila clavipes]
MSSREVERKERWEASDHSLGVLPPNRSGPKSNRPVTCVVQKASAKDISAFAAMNFVDIDLTTVQVRYKASTSSGDKCRVRWRAASKEMMMQLEDRSSPGSDCFSDNKCEARFNDTLPKSSITFI